MLAKAKIAPEDRTQDIGEKIHLFSRHLVEAIGSGVELPKSIAWLCDGGYKVGRMCVSEMGTSQHGASRLEGNDGLSSCFTCWSARPIRSLVTATEGIHSLSAVKASGGVWNLPLFIEYP
jgi:hypothetical protein